MKKTLSIILASVIIISSLVALALPVSAEETEYVLGEWDVKMLETAKSDKNYPPLSGYHYDEKGFHTYSPNFSREHWGSNRRTFTVVSKEKFDIKNFSMTVVVHDYSNYKGSYNWISFSVWSESNGMAQGDTSANYGDGWTSLIRYDDDGIGNRFESWNQTIGGRSGKQQFSSLDDTQMNPIVFEPILDEETGDFILTFAITDGVTTINGTPIGSKTDDCIDTRFGDEGSAYFSVTLHNTDTSSNYKPAISLIDVNGEVPYGSDSRPPERRIFIHPPVYNEDDPYILFDATLENANSKLPRGSGCEIDFADDNESIKVTAREESFYIDFEVSDFLNYKADQFTYIAVILKNFCTCEIDEGESLNDACVGAEMGSIWYYVGKVNSPQNDCFAIIPTYYTVTPKDAAGEWIYDDMYTVGILQVVNDHWIDRIHGFRLEIDQYTNYGVDGKNTFEIMGAGIFKNNNDLSDFVSEFRSLGLDTSLIDMEYIDCFHEDTNGDNICDICFEELEQPTDIEGTTTEETHPIECYCFDGDKDGYCDFCFRPYNNVESDTIFVHPETESSSAEIISEYETQTEISDTTEKISDTDEVESAENTTVASTPDSEDIYDGDALIVFSGCESTAAFSAISIVAIIGSAVLIRKKED